MAEEKDDQGAPLEEDRSGVHTIHGAIEPHDVQEIRQVPDIKLGVERDPVPFAGFDNSEDAAAHDAHMNELVAEGLTKGKIVKIDHVPGTDMIQFETEFGHKELVLRIDAIHRARGLLQMLLKETDSADAADVDKEIWYVHKTFQAIVASARAQGKPYSSKSIKQFMDLLRQADKSWKKRSDVDQAGPVPWDNTTDKFAI